MTTHKTHRGLIPFFMADSLSEIGDVFYYIALITFASGLKDAPLAITLVTTLEYLPPLFSMFLGEFADRFENKIVAAFMTNIIQAVLYIINTLAFIFLSDWHLLIVCLVINFMSDFGGVFYDDLEPSLITKIAPLIPYEKKYGWLSSISGSFSLIGKFLGGFLLTLVSGNVFVVSLINALTFIVAAFLMLRAGHGLENTKETSDDDDEDDQEPHGSFSPVKYINTHSKIRLMIILMSAMNIALAPLMTIIYILLSNHTISSSVNYADSISFLTAAESFASILGPIIGLKLFSGKSALFKFPELSNQVQHY